MLLDMIRHKINIVNRKTEEFSNLLQENIYYYNIVQKYRLIKMNKQMIVGIYLVNSINMEGRYK